MMTNLPEPSTLPVVPISAKRNWMTCSGDLCIRLQISATFAKMERRTPSRRICGGAIVYRFPAEVRREGLEA